MTIVHAVAREKAKQTKVQRAGRNLPCRRIAARVLAALLTTAFAAADTKAGVCEFYGHKADRLSNPEGWDTFPVSGFSGSVARFFLWGRTVINDLGDDFILRQIQVTQGANGGTYEGDAFNIGSGGITVHASPDSNPDGTVYVHTFNNTIRAWGKDTVLSSETAYDRLVFNGLLTGYGDTFDNKNFYFKSTGGIEINGGLVFDKETGDGIRQDFARGTVYVNSDVLIPSAIIEGYTRLVISNGATFKTWSDNNTFLQQCTIDIEDGAYINGGGCCAAQSETANVVINVGAKGLLDTVKSMRLGNNGAVTVNVSEGGRAILRGSLCEEGGTYLNFFGGKTVWGYDNGQFRLTYGRANTSSLAPSSVNFAGGEIWFSSFEDSSVAKDRPVYVYLDGSELNFTASGNAFAFSGTGNAEHLKFHMREHGITINTHENDIVWNDVTIRGTDVASGTDGDLVKMGIGKFELAASVGSTGRTVVRNGIFHVDDPSYLTGPVAVRPRAVLSFTGSTLALSALEVKSGIVKLEDGQTLALSAAPTVDGQLVFDVNVVDGVRTLLTAPGLTDSIVASCRVRSPVAGKSCTFSFDGENLVLTVADGTAPEAPSFPPSEDLEVQSKSADTPVEFGREPWNSLGGTGDFRYVGTDDAEVNAFRMTGSSVIRTSQGAGDLTITGPAQSGADLDGATLGFYSANDNAIRFAGDWLSQLEYPDSGIPYKLLPGTGNFIYGPSLLPSDLFVGLKVFADSTHTVEDTEFKLNAMVPNAAPVPGRFGSRTSFILDGGVIKVGEAGSGSFDDFLRGVTSFTLGEKGGAIDTCGNDITIRQTLVPSRADDTVFVKNGEGSLTLGGRDNAIFGTLIVSNGTLKAGFDTSVRRPYPEGAMAIWNFDGESPYSDKSGHGLDLYQSHPENVEVGFTAENALSGRAAKWSDEQVGGSLTAANITETTFAGKTISAWVRFDNLTLDGGHANILSTRTKRDYASGAGTSFDIAYKHTASTNGVPVPGGLFGFESNWADARVSIWDYMVGHAPTVQEWHHVCMVNDGSAYYSYLDGVCYVNGYPGAAPQFLSPDYLITLGQGHGTGEFMNKGGMIDEVAIWPRALSSDEVLSLYAAEGKSAAFDLEVVDGAVWDMNGTTSTVSTVTGSGSVTNGLLVITKAFVSTPEAAPLTVDAISFGPNGTFDLGYGDERRARGLRPLIKFASIDADGLANVRSWTITNEGSDRHSFVSISVRGDGVYANVTPPGMCVIVR